MSRIIRKFYQAVMVLGFIICSLLALNLVLPPRASGIAGLGHHQGKSLSKHENTDFMQAKESGRDGASAKEQVSNNTMADSILNKKVMNKKMKTIS
jgi:hypothetical protein